MYHVFINSVEYPRVLRDFSIRKQAGNKCVSTIAVEIPPDYPLPVSGDIVEIKDGDGTLMFWGTCGIPQSPKYSTGHEAHIYSIQCGDANTILAYRIVNESYTGYTVSDIVGDLFTNYISQEGITIGQISSVPVVVNKYNASNFNLQDALNELADLVGCTWSISTDKKFFFIRTDDFPQFPRTIDSDFLLGTEWQETTKDYKVRTVQYVAGATEYTYPQTEEFAYLGYQTSFAVSFPVSQKPTVYINSTAVSADHIGVAGLNDGDPNYYFLFAYNSKTVVYNAYSEALTTGDVVEINYIGMFPIRISLENESKIAEIAEATGTSGRREMVELASSLKTAADAQALAESLLEQFSVATSDVSFWFLSNQLTAAQIPLSALDILTKITINLPQIRINGDYVITERTITPFSSDGSVFKVTIKAMDRNYMKSYGETISKIKKDVNQLTIRADDVVLKYQTVGDTMVLAEAISYIGNIIYYPQAVASQNGQHFDPIDFGGEVYPI